MKLVRQLVERHQSIEGQKKVGDEYAVSAARATDLLRGRIVEVVSDITKTEAKELVAEEGEPAPVKKTTARKKTAKK